MVLLGVRRRPRGTLVAILFSVPLPAQAVEKEEVIQVPQEAMGAVEAAVDLEIHKQIRAGLEIHPAPLHHKGVMEAPQHRRVVVNMLLVVVVALVQVVKLLLRARLVVVVAQERHPAYQGPQSLTLAEVVAA